MTKNIKSRLNKDSSESDIKPRKEKRKAAIAAHAIDKLIMLGTNTTINKSKNSIKEGKTITVKTLKEEKINKLKKEEKRVYGNKADEFFKTRNLKSTTTFYFDILELLCLWLDISLKDELTSIDMLIEELKKERSVQIQMFLSLNPATENEWNDDGDEKIKCSGLGLLVFIIKNRIVLNWKGSFTVLTRFFKYKENCDHEDTLNYETDFFIAEVPKKVMDTPSTKFIIKTISADVKAVKCYVLTTEKSCCYSPDIFTAQKMGHAVVKQRMKEQHAKEKFIKYEMETNDNESEEINDNECEETDDNESEEINDNESEEINDNECEETDDNESEETDDNESEEMGMKVVGVKNEIQTANGEENQTPNEEENQGEAANEEENNDNLYSRRNAGINSKNIEEDLMLELKKKNLEIFDSVDIDGIMGIVTLDEVSTVIQGPLTVEFKPYLGSKNKLLTKEYVFKGPTGYQTIGTCDNKFIGQFQESIGDLNVFIVYPSVRKNLHIRDKIINDAITRFINLEGCKDSNKVLCASGLSKDTITGEISGNVGYSNLLLFFKIISDALLEKNQKFFFFIEVLGNKNKTRSPDVKSLLDLVCKSIRLDLTQYLKIDFCIEKVTNAKYANSPSSKAYYRWGLIPNYLILFTKRLSNHWTRAKKTTYKNKKFIKKYLWKSGFCEKINIYSRVEDLLKAIRNPTYRARLSLLHFKTKILKKDAKTVMAQNLKQDLIDLINRCFDIPIPYRYEVRIDTIFIYDVCRIYNLKQKEYHNISESKKLGVVIKKMVGDFLIHLNNLSNSFTVMDVGKLAILECLLHNFYFKGERNYHFIPSELRNTTDNFFKEKDFYDDPSKNPNFDIIIPSTFTENKMFQMLMTLYDSENDTSEFTEEVIKIICSATCKNDALRIIVCALLSNVGGLYDMFRLDFTLIGAGEYLLKNHIDFCIIYDLLFEHPKKMYQKFNYFKMKTISEYMYGAILISEVQEVFQSLSVECFYNLSGQSRSPNLYEINYRGNSTFNKIRNKTVLVENLEIMLRRNPVPNTPFPWKNVDESKYVHAWAHKIIRGSTWPLMIINPFLGLFGTRCIRKMKQNLNYMKGNSSSEQLKVIFQNAAMYEPREISFEERYNEILKFRPGLIGNLDFRRRIKRLFLIEKNRYNPCSSKEILNVLYRKFEYGDVPDTFLATLRNQEELIQLDQDLSTDENSEDEEDHFVKITRIEGDVNAPNESYADLDPFEDQFNLDQNDYDYDQIYQRERFDEDNKSRCGDNCQLEPLPHQRLWLVTLPAKRRIIDRRICLWTPLLLVKRHLEERRKILWIPEKPLKRVTDDDGQTKRQRFCTKLILRKALSNIGLLSLSTNYYFDNYILHNNFFLIPEYLSNYQPSIEIEPAFLASMPLNVLKSSTILEFALLALMPPNVPESSDVVDPVLLKSFLEPEPVFQSEIQLTQVNTLVEEPYIALAESCFSRLFYTDFAPCIEFSNFKTTIFALIKVLYYVDHKTMSYLYCSVLNKNKRPSTAIWENTIDIMVEKGIITKTVRGRGFIIRLVR